jgi:RNA polymerase sigma-70 factor (ECF subfamily)
VSETTVPAQGLADAAADEAREAPYPSDDARLARLVQDHHVFVWRSLRRLGVPVADVDDATQKVFLIAARRL